MSIDRERVPLSALSDRDLASQFKPDGDDNSPQIVEILKALSGDHNKITDADLSKYRSALRGEIQKI